MIAPCQVNAFRVSHLQSHQKRDCLHWIVASVYEIAHEEIVRIWYVSTYGEQLNEIVKLSVYVPADGDWSSDWRSICLLWQNVLSFISDEFGLFFRDAFKSFNIFYDSIELSFIGHLKFIN